MKFPRTSTCVNFKVWTVPSRFELFNIVTYNRKHRWFLKKEIMDVVFSYLNYVVLYLKHAIAICIFTIYTCLPSTTGIINTDEHMRWDYTTWYHTVVQYQLRIHKNCQWSFTLICTYFLHLTWTCWLIGQHYNI